MMYPNDLLQKKLMGSSLVVNINNLSPYSGGRMVSDNSSSNNSFIPANAPPKMPMNFNAYMQPSASRPASSASGQPMFPGPNFRNVEKHSYGGIQSYRTSPTKYTCASYESNGRDTKPDDPVLRGTPSPQSNRMVAYRSNNRSVIYADEDSRSAKYGLDKRKRSNSVFPTQYVETPGRDPKAAQEKGRTVKFDGENSMRASQNDERQSKDRASTSRTTASKGSSGKTSVDKTDADKWKVEGAKAQQAASERAGVYYKKVETETVRSPTAAAQPVSKPNLPTRSTEPSLKNVKKQITFDERDKILMFDKPSESATSKTSSVFAKAERKGQEYPEDTALATLKNPPADASIKKIRFEKSHRSYAYRKGPLPSVSINAGDEAMNPYDSISNFENLVIANKMNMIKQWNGCAWERVDHSFKFFIKAKYDQKGELWGVRDNFTVSKLCRGKFRDYNFIGNEQVADIAFDKKNTVWCVSRNGRLLRWNRTEWCQLNYKGFHKLLSITFDKDGRLWGLNAKRSLGVWNEKLKNWEEKVIANNLKIRTMDFDKKGMLWVVSTSGSLLSYSSEKWMNHGYVCPDELISICLKK